MSVAVKRYVLRALAGLSLAVGVSLIARWIRSYTSAERLHGRAWSLESWMVASKEGRVTLLWFTSHGHPQWWQWSIHSYAVDDVMAFPTGNLRQYESCCGFGRIERPLYFVMRPTYQTPEGTTVHLLGAATATLNGSGLIVPYWMLVLIAFTTSILLVVSWPPRFSILSLLTMMSVISVTLGLVAILDR